jgi:hypothetical protein
VLAIDQVLALDLAQFAMYLDASLHYGVLILVPASTHIKAGQKSLTVETFRLLPSTMESHWSK